MTATPTQNLQIASVPGPQGQAPGGPGSAGRRRDLAAALRPLMLDVGIPVGTYYLLRDAFGVSLWLSLALSSTGPAVRAIAGLVAERTLNLLAMLMLAVTLAGIAASMSTASRFSFRSATRPAVPRTAGPMLLSARESHTLTPNALRSR